MKIVLLATRDPRGRATGRKSVLRTMLRSLTTLGHEVVVVAFGLPAADEGWPGVRFVFVPLPRLGRVALNVLRHNLARRLSLNECLYHSPAAAARIRAIVEREQADLVIADMVRTAQYALACGRPWLLDLDDLLSERCAGWQRTGARLDSLLGYYASALPGPVARLGNALAGRALAWEAGVLREREIAMARSANGVSLVSPVEAEELERRSGRPVWWLPMAIDVPAELPRPRLEQRPMRMVFTGGLDYQPNLEAVRYYRDAVAPVLRRHGLGHLDLAVIGHCPAELRPGLMAPGLSLLGYVDDLWGTVAQMQVMLAPIRSGTGLKTKVLEALLAGLPVVSTPEGVYGLGVEDQVHCLVWNTPGQLAEILARLEEDPRFAARIAAAGQAHARQRFTPAVLAGRWSAALADTMAATHA